MVGVAAATESERALLHRHYVLGTPFIPRFLKHPRPRFTGTGFLQGGSCRHFPCDATLFYCYGVVCCSNKGWRRRHCCHPLPMFPNYQRRRSTSSTHLWNSPPNDRATEIKKGELRYCSAVKPTPDMHGRKRERSHDFHREGERLPGSSPPQIRKLAAAVDDFKNALAAPTFRTGCRPDRYLSYH